MDGQDLRQRQSQAPNDSSEADYDKRTVDERREQDLSQLRCHISLEYVPDRMEFGVVRITNEVCRKLAVSFRTELAKPLTKNASSHDLSAHGDEQGKVEHVTGADKPMYKHGGERKIVGKQHPRL